MFVVPFAPEHNCVRIAVGVGVTPGFGVPVSVGVPPSDEDGLHWKAGFCVRSGASDRLIEL